MHVSEARIAANRANAQKSSGPRSMAGKLAARRNGLKHGLSGEGVVVPEEDQDEIELRTAALTTDLKPMSIAGVFLIAQMATLSVRAERASTQESAALSMRVRHATDDYNEEQIDEAERLFQGLADDPRNHHRKLLKFPEGVARLCDAWIDLRADLAIDNEMAWTNARLEQAANLTGLAGRHARGSRLGALSRAYWGDFAALDPADGAGLDDEARREWAKSALFELIDAEIAGLEAHYLTLDFDTIDLDRAEAGSRALFDFSKAATLARRYEAEARRGFFKALKEFRQVEADFASQNQAAPATSQAPKPSPTAPTMGSSWENPPDRVRRSASDLSIPESIAQLAPKDPIPLVFASPSARNPLG